MIPKIIHYCWFGGSEMPDTYKSYISEWKDIHPDWEIMRWDETNSPMSLPYMQKALAGKNWANMSNFVRLYVLKKIGGIYLDTDMKILKPLDFFLSNKCFFGFEEGTESSDIFWVNNAIVGSEKNHKFINSCYKALLNDFDGLEAPNESSPRLTTRLLKDLRALKKYGSQTLGDITLYPLNIFYPISYENAYKTRSIKAEDYPDSYAIHTWGRTWFSQEFMLEIIDQKQELIVNQKTEIEKISNELQNTSSVFKVINDQKNYVEEINTFNEETKRGLQEFKNVFLEKLTETNNRLDSIDTIQEIVSKQEGAINDNVKCLKIVSKKIDEIGAEKRNQKEQEEKDHISTVEIQNEINTNIKLLQNSITSQIESNNTTVSNNKDIRIFGLEKELNENNIIVQKLEKQIAIQLEINDIHKSNIKKNEQRINEVENQNIEKTIENKILDNSLSIQILLNEDKEIIIKNIENNIEKIQIQNRVLEKTIAIQISANENKEIIIKKLENNIEEIQIQNRALEKTITIQLEKNDALKSSIEEDEMRINEIENRNNELSNQNKILDNSLSIQISVNENKEGIISKLEDVLIAKDTRIKICENELFEKEKTIEVLNVEIKNNLKQNEEALIDYNSKLEKTYKEFSEYQKYQIQKHVLENLQKEYNKKISEIQWYKDTFENRSLLGIIKSKLFNH